ncbi:hypothetical protein RLT58_04780 [Streptomyces sp. ITFR-16]|nr:hypothetical protein [Streptomyces sp. ITFR-16]WNI21283.1 hypothetical protein RLT58_04780 [Streptomyces sp. ITFR-16]
MAAADTLREGTVVLDGERPAPEPADSVLAHAGLVPAGSPGQHT